MAQRLKMLLFFISVRMFDGGVDSFDLRRSLKPKEGASWRLETGGRI